MKQLPVAVDPPQNRPMALAFQRSCCFLKSTTAAVLIAALYSLLSLASGTFCVVILTVKSVRGKMVWYVYEYAKEYNKNNSYYYHYSEMSYEEFENLVLLWVKLSIGIAALVFLFCIMVFHGVSAGKPCHLIPLYVWIFLKVILSIMYFCFYSNDDNDSYFYSMWGLLIIIVILGIKMYFLVCIWNAFKQLKFQTSQQNGYDLVYQPGLPNYNQAVMGKEPPPPAYSP